MNAVHGSILDSFKGALLGTAVGDALGMPVEGWQHEKIAEQHEVLKEMEEARAGRGTYTDDTEMMIALAESLVEKQKVDKNHLTQSFLKNFHDWRGYGHGTTTVLELLRRRISVEEAAAALSRGLLWRNFHKTCLKEWSLIGRLCTWSGCS